MERSLSRVARAVDRLYAERQLLSPGGFWPDVQQSFLLEYKTLTRTMAKPLSRRQRLILALNEPCKRRDIYE